MKFLTLRIVWKEDSQTFSLHPVVMEKSSSEIYQMGLDMCLPELHEMY